MSELRADIARRETIVDGQPLDGRLCQKCGGAIGQAKHYRVGVDDNESNFHPHCFVCCVCDRALLKETFRERDGALYCAEHFGEAFWCAFLINACSCVCVCVLVCLRCFFMFMRVCRFVCLRGSRARARSTALNHSSLRALCAPTCQRYCSTHSPRCAGCDKPILDEEFSRALDQSWHFACFGACGRCCQAPVPKLNALSHTHAHAFRAPQHALTARRHLTSSMCAMPPRCRTATRSALCARSKLCRSPKLPLHRQRRRRPTRLRRRL